MIKSGRPFMKLYNYVTPEEFIMLFKNEIPQTIAFILSFCPKKSFIKKTIRLLEKKKKNTGALETIYVIQEYLSRRYNNTNDNELISIVEEQIFIMTDGYKYHSGSKNDGFWDDLKAMVNNEKNVNQRIKN